MAKCSAWITEALNVIHYAIPSPQNPPILHISNAPAVLRQSASPRSLKFCRGYCPTLTPDFWETWETEFERKLLIIVSITAKHTLQATKGSRLRLRRTCARRRLTLAGMSLILWAFALRLNSRGNFLPAIWRDRPDPDGSARRSLSPRLTRRATKSVKRAPHGPRRDLSNCIRGDCQSSLGDAVAPERRWRASAVGPARIGMPFR
jgi:hypothetical protein